MSADGDFAGAQQLLLDKGYRSLNDLCSDTINDQLLNLRASRVAAAAHKAGDHQARKSSNEDD